MGQGIAVATCATERLKEPITSRIQYGMSPIAITRAYSRPLSGAPAKSAGRRQA
jgi:hypothetical protein